MIEYQNKNLNGFNQKNSQPIENQEMGFKNSITFGDTQGTQGENWLETLVGFHLLYDNHPTLL